MRQNVIFARITHEGQQRTAFFQWQANGREVNQEGAEKSTRETGMSVEQEWLG